MPAIFSEKERRSLTEAMLETGFSLVCEKGFHGLTVDEITQSVGIAKGTFYSFFPSKEEFIYQIVLSKRLLISQIFENEVEKNGGVLDRAGFEKWLRLMWYSENNIYRQITQKDYEYISERWPQERSFDADLDRETSEWLLGKLEGVRNSANWKVFVNIQKLLAFMNLNRERVHQDALHETTEALIKAMCDEIFE